MHFKKKIIKVLQPMNYILSKYFFIVNLKHKYYVVNLYDFLYLWSRYKCLT